MRIARRKFLAFSCIAYLAAACAQSKNLRSEEKQSLRPGDETEDWETYVSETIDHKQSGVISKGSTTVSVAAGSLPSDYRIRLARRTQLGTSRDAFEALLLESSSEAVKVEIIDASAESLIPNDELRSAVVVTEQIAEPSERSKLSFFYLVFDDEQKTVSQGSTPISETAITTLDTKLQPVSVQAGLLATSFVYQFGVPVPAAVEDGIDESGGAEEVDDSPVLSLVIPNQVSTRGQAKIKLGGLGFKPGITVQLGDVGCLDLVYVNSTELVCTVPAAAAAGEVSITATNPSGRSTTAAKKLTYSASNSWRAISTTNAPSGRLWHSAIWTGEKILIWGGMTASGVTNTGGVYDPQNNSWTSMSTTNAPEARWYHGAVWTGKEMIVWGGARAMTSDDLETGGRYDPQTDTWKSLNTTGAPNKRIYSRAIWTGSKMLVWGGVSSFDPGAVSRNDGALYDPTTDTWTAMTSNNPPQARYAHSVTWTGSKLFVFGGLSGISTDSKMNNGSIYDLAADVWTPTSTASQPSPRFWPTSEIWTGSEVIIIGGGPDEGLQGGRYHVADDRWTAISTTNAPAHRQGVVGVWTGDRAVTWGGSYAGGASYTDQGGIYDPETNSWTATSTIDVPAARWKHTMIWTGGQVLIFGGTGQTVHMDDGAVFTP
jgi:N-acetylneuraminic acid mutarotase